MYLKRYRLSTFESRRGQESILKFEGWQSEGGSSGGDVFGFCLIVCVCMCVCVGVCVS